ncbi:integrase catalytic domain-containing protein [Trichonephila clavipes]|nr:integrase catalytic domain-containing protein [Trichonephila clavipes]
MTRVLFGVKSSPFLLAATIKHHLKKYVDIFPDTFNHLNQSLYVDDFLCGNVSVQAALTTCIESKQILEDASMDLRKWRSNSSELNQRLKNLNFEVDEHKGSLNTLIASKVLGVGWNEKSDTFYFDSSDLGTFLSKKINTKRYLLQVAGRLFDPGGRLKHSTLSEFQKQKAHHLTDLIIEHYHKKSLHSGLQTTLYLIRQFYWIPSGQNRVRRILNKCITCFRTKTQTINQMMGDLPRDRIVPSRPFEKVGLDYAGPIITKPNLKRSRVTLKSYIAIFICFSTKATHLEVVSDLTTEAFLACLRRFIARRSKPSVIWSDNATNFKGARNILSEWNEICKSNRIQLFSAEEGIEWNFIPTASPHFGGLWEANIKSMKRILLRVAKSAIMNFEELTTLMAQIEAVLNSRPLSPLSSDPNDLNPLTPGHFLTNCAISSFSEPYTASDSLSYHSSWKLVQSLRDKFWNRWSTEYLTHPQTRAKWSEQNPNFMENQLVLLKDRNTKPLDWPMGRILEVFPGSDGLVRVVNVKTSTGILKRAITKVVPLPIPVDPATVEKNI